ncbi:MAG: FtsQ-type POTRA domain-containing protein [Kiritimatiellae bacterium]|nr:FtsQ-type POTRA domain-containing protein [Kiritimatiellia bacterium]
MAFSKKKVNSRSKKGRRTQKQPSLIQLYAKKPNKRRNQSHAKAKVAVSVVSLVVLVSLAVGLLAGSRWIVAKLYSRNSTFVIKHIEIKGSLMMSPALVREYTKLDEGLNLFAINIKQIRNDFLRRSPSVKFMDISRDLPDTLEINIIERIPLAKLGKRGPLVVGRYGMIFVFKGPTSQLPVLWGYDSRRARPGVKVFGIAQAALETLRAIDEDPSLGLDVARVNVSHKDHLFLHLTDGKVIKLAWNDMGMQTDISQQELLKVLDKVSIALHSKRGMNLILLDATLDNDMPGNYAQR